jgi:hypothetical protein
MIVGSRLLRTTSTRIARTVLALVACGGLARADAPADSALAALPDRGRSPEVFLTWHAPWGEPRATAGLNVTCGDTTRVDTLYLCASPGRDVKQFVGMSGVFVFHAAPGESLDGWWNFPRGRGEASSILLRMDPEPGFGGVQPWPTKGFGMVDLRTSPVDARLAFIYALPTGLATGAREDSVYCLAKLLLRRPPSAATCGRAVCVEAVDVKLAFGAEVGEFLAVGPNRLAVWNAEAGDPCAPMREGRAPRRWSPGRR